MCVVDNGEPERARGGDYQVIFGLNILGFSVLYMRVMYLYDDINIQI